MIHPAAATGFAAAVHWFDGAAALTEIHRVLRPGGRLDEQTFPNAQVLDAGGLADRVGSTSFIASLPDAGALSGAHRSPRAGRRRRGHRRLQHRAVRLG
jgi:hypothetical protein